MIKKFFILLTNLFLNLGNLFFRILNLFFNLIFNQLNSNDNLKENTKENTKEITKEITMENLNGNTKQNIKESTKNAGKNVNENLKDNGIKKYFENLIFKLKSNLSFNNENNGEKFIFKQLNSEYNFNKKYNNVKSINSNNNYNKHNNNNNQSNNNNNNNNSIGNKYNNDINYIEKMKSFQNHYLNGIIGKSISETINIRLAIPIALIIVIILSLVVYVFFGIEIAIAVILLFLLGVFGIFYLPKIKKDQNNSEISKELPYALRQMVTELRSGKGLHDTMNSIANSDYGTLSYEFSRALEEIKYGENTEKSLLSMSERNSSEGLNIPVQQIIGTIRTGGNLSTTLNIIAEDISSDFQIKLKDYSQKLNAFIMIYMFLAILGPVVFLIMLMAVSTLMGDIIPSNVILIIYIFFFPMIVVFMGLMIKKLEPTI